MISEKELHYIETEVIYFHRVNKPFFILYNKFTDFLKGIDKYTLMLNTNDILKQISLVLIGNKRNSPLKNILKTAYKLPNNLITPFKHYLTWLTDGLIMVNIWLSVNCVGYVKVDTLTNKINRIYTFNYYTYKIHILINKIKEIIRRVI